MSGGYARHSGKVANWPLAEGAGFCEIRPSSGNASSPTVPRSVAKWRTRAAESPASHQGEPTMRTHLTLVALLLLGATAAVAQYGDISDLKLLRPEDKVDVKPTPPPSGAVVLFD